MHFVTYLYLFVNGLLTMALFQQRLGLAILWSGVLLGTCS